MNPLWVEVNPLPGGSIKIYAQIQPEEGTIAGGQQTGEDTVSYRSSFRCAGTKAASLYLKE